MKDFFEIIGLQETFFRVEFVVMHNFVPCLCCGSLNKCDLKQIINDYSGNKYLICKCCNSWFQLAPAEIEYGLEYFSKVVDPDGVTRDMLLEREFKIKNWFCETIDYVNTKSPGKILDIGAGLGFFLSAVNDSWVKFANESSAELVNFLQKQYSNIHIVSKIDADFICKHENSFDVIFLYHVIEHLKHPNEMMQVVRRLLKNNGELIIGTPNIGSLCAKIFKGNFRLLGYGHLCLYNKKSLISLAKKNGFECHMVKYPFFRTDYFTIKNVLRLLNPKKVSPPFYGSVMNLYLRVKK